MWNLDMILNKQPHVLVDKIYLSDLTSNLAFIAQLRINLELRSRYLYGNGVSRVQQIQLIEPITTAITTAPAGRHFVMHFKVFVF